MTQALSEDLVKLIRERVDSENGIVAYARSHSINKGHVSMAYNGEYLSPKMRLAMGLPNPKPTQTCACGEVHTVPWCTKEKGAPVKETEKEIVYVEVQPKPKPKRKSKPAPYRTLAIRFHDDDDFDRARRVLADYDGTRAEWMMEQVKENER